MNQREHYEEAERILVAFRAAIDGNEITHHEDLAATLAWAQVHATLAACPIPMME